MSSTSVFQGAFGDKPSSRVTRPPGGASSNIFGTVEEKPVASLPSQTSTPQMTSGAQWISGSESPVVINRSEVVKTADEPPKTGSPSKVVADDARVTSTDAGRGDSSRAKRGGGFNPITGEAYNTDAKQTVNAKVNPSIAVKQPPGGASTPLW